MVRTVHDLAELIQEQGAIYKKGTEQGITAAYRTCENRIVQIRNDRTRHSRNPTNHSFGLDRRDSSLEECGTSYVPFFDSQYRETGRAFLSNLCSTHMRNFLKERKKKNNLYHKYEREEGDSKVEIEFATQIKDYPIIGEMAEEVYNLVAEHQDRVEAEPFCYTVPRKGTTCQLDYYPVEVEHVDGRVSIRRGMHNRYRCHWVVIRLYLKSSDGEWLPSSQYLTWYPQHESQRRRKCKMSLSLDIMQKYARITVIHTLKENLEKFETKTASLFRECVMWRPEEGLHELQTRVVRYIHYASHRMRVVKGNEVMVDVLAKALCVVHGLPLPTYNDTLPSLFAYAQLSEGSMIEHSNELFALNPFTAEALKTVEAEDEETAHSSAIIDRLCRLLRLS